MAGIGNIMICHLKSFASIGSFGGVKKSLDRRDTVAGIPLGMISGSLIISCLSLALPSFNL